jgi:hypothetical protein
MVAVVRVLEEEDGVNNVPTQEEALVGGDRGRDAAEFGVADKNCGQEERAVSFGLCGTGKGGTVDACGEGGS